MNEHAIITPCRHSECGDVYHVEWFDDREKAFAYRRGLLAGGADAVWYVHCPLAIVTIEAVSE